MLELLALLVFGLPVALGIIFGLRLRSLFKRVTELEQENSLAHERLKFLTRKFGDMEREFQRIRNAAPEAPPLVEKSATPEAAPPITAPAASQVLPERVIQPEAPVQPEAAIQPEAAVQPEVAVQPPESLAAAASSEEPELPSTSRPAQAETVQTRKSGMMNYQPPRRPAPPEPEAPSYWKNLEQQLSDNWTGIGGSLFLVLGIAFLGIHTALKMSEFSRFLMISGVSGLLFALFYWLRTRETWLKLALWMRSASGGVFLFACLGAGGVPGLKWINDPTAALGLLILGILVNVWLAFLGGSQTFASLHVLLSLAAISVAPASTTTLALAGLVTVTGIVLSHRERWDYHLLATIAAFYLFHVNWYLALAQTTAEVPWLLRGGQFLDKTANISGMASVILVFLAAASVHYRDLYKKLPFHWKPYTVHLLNWFFLGSGLLMHATGSKWKTIPLFLAGMLAFALARRAKNKEIRWLYHTDTMMAQIISCIAVISLYKWGLSPAVSMTLAYLEWLVFTRIMMQEREEKLFRLGTAGVHLLGSALTGWGLFIYLVSPTATSFDLSPFLLSSQADHSLQMGLIMLVAGFFTLLWHSRLASRENARYLVHDGLLSLEWGRDTECSFTGFMAPVMLLAAGLLTISSLPLAIIVCLLFCYQLRVRQYAGTNGMALGTLVGVTGFFVAQWHFSDVIPSLVPAASYLICAAAFRWSFVPGLQRHAKWYGIYLGTLHTLYFSALVLNPSSPLAPGVLWLLLSLVALHWALSIQQAPGAGSAIPGEPDRYLLHSAYILIAAFIARHLLIDLQCEAYLGPMKARGLVELFALTVFAYWAFGVRTPVSHSGSFFNSWLRLHPLFIEMMLIFTVLFFSLQTDKYWHSTIWGILAMALLKIGQQFRTPRKSLPEFTAGDLSRLRLYSVFFYLASIFQTAILLGIYEKLGTYWFHRAWVLGSISIVIQIFFLIQTYRSGTSGMIPPALPKCLTFLRPAAESVYEARNVTIFYPLILGVTLFLFWTFDRSTLTLLWVLECFVIFSLSIQLREAHFRHVALAGLALCIGRLLLHDLATAATLTKAMVFVGVGVLMIGMHALYNRYRDQLMAPERNLGIGSVKGGEENEQ